MSTGAGATGGDGLNLGHPTFSEPWCSCKTDTTGNNKIHEETLLRESAAVPREHNAGENLSTHNNMQRADVGETQEACILNQFRAEPGHPGHMNVSSSEDFSACPCPASKQAAVLDNLRVTAYLGIICRASISFDYPVKLKTRMEFLFGSSKTKKKRVKNVTDENNHSVVPNLREAYLGDSYGLQKGVTFSPVGQWLINTISGNGKVLDTLRSPLFINLTDQDKSITQDGSSYTETKEASCSDCDCSFPVGLHDTTSHARYVESMGDTGCDSDTTTRREFSDDVFLSCSSSRTTDSNQSSLPTSRGFLQCIWEGGIPHFVFSLDDQDKNYLASPWRVESSEDKALDWIYLFHVKASGREKQIKGGSRDSEFVGKMKVSSSVSLDCDNASKFIETEYVLFGVNGAHNEELKQAMVNLKPIRKKSKGMQKKVTGIFRTPHSSKQQPHSNLVPSSSIYDECPQILLYRRTNFSNMAAEKILMGQLIPNLEMAAIVVKVRTDQSSNQETAIGGWGLKFLKKKEVDPGFSSNGSRSMQNFKDKLITNMTMLVPDDFHGGPHGEPSTLLERWRSGGHCDCGGWDVGCPIKVLDGGPCREESFSHTEPKEACGSFDVFMKGTRESLPALKMVRVCEGLYCVHFQSTLSALQSFSTAVAMIHSQSPPLFFKMYNT
ncbi:hypothetical protein EJ110_NYTH38584 [Nymphaea thermarum]|nr:hypothetical protein EJ110_NYTH38584 [Nymphaea thermarum]